MQDHTTATDQDIGQAAKVPRASQGWWYGCIGVVFACIVLYFAVRLSNGHIVLSTLPVKELPAVNLREVCGNSMPLWPPVFENPNPKFPAYSPDEKWYVNLVTVNYPELEQLQLYKTESNQPLGSYSFYNVDIFCWANDSSGIYIEDSLPGSFFDFLGGSPWNSHLKEVLIPCQGNLHGVSIWMQSYWGMRCAMPDKYGPLATWLPFILLLIGGALVVVALVWIWRWLAQKQKKP